MGRGAIRVGASFCLDGWTPLPPPPVPPPEEQRAFSAALKEAVRRRWPDYPPDEALGVLSIASMYSRPYLLALIEGPWPASGMDSQVRRDLERALGCRLPAIAGAADLAAAAKAKAAKGLFVKKTPPQVEQETLPLLGGEEVRPAPEAKAVRVGDAAPRRRGKAKRRRRTARARTVPKTVKAGAAKTKAAKQDRPRGEGKHTAPTKQPRSGPKNGLCVDPGEGIRLARALTAVGLEPDRAARLAGLDPKALTRMLAGRARMPQAVAERLRGLVRAARDLREETR